MRNDQLALGGIVLLALAAGLALPKVANKGRLAVRRATGSTHRSGVSRPGVRTNVDPARGVAA